MAAKLKIVLGTSNSHKVHEINEIAREYNVEFILPDCGGFNPDENGSTFEENAEIKAKEASRVSKNGNYFMADDSGLCVDYLNGGPGIHSARYDTTPEKRIEKLLDALKDDKKRTARFVCALCLCDKEGKVLHKEKGTVEGKISYSKKGLNGFGYDPVFLVEDKNKTMAELTEEEKNTLSHRGRALKCMLEWVKVNFKI